LEVGATPTTNKIAILRHGPSLQRTQAGSIETIFFPHPLLEKASVVDTPGLDSIFKGHDETTNKFLHRADTVLLVMLATQAMSASNVTYLQSLRAYGKRMIVAINQIDLLEPEERETIKAFVLDQSKQHLGFVPEVWMLSSKLASEAERQSPRDEALWEASGFAQIERFINRQLSDAERVRQKLETPLQISRNVLSIALATIREQQDALADHRRAAQNVKSQIDAGLREQDEARHQTVEDLEKTFAEATMRGREAIRDTFQLGRGVRLAFGGVGELFGLGRIFRRMGAVSPAQAAFTGRRVDEPLEQIPIITEKLAPRLEGRDIKDVDDLINYTRKEIEHLPASLKGRVIGKIQMPTSYDRKDLASVREDLRKLLDQAKGIELKTIDASVLSSLSVLGLYELLVIVFGVLGTLIAASWPDNRGIWIIFAAVTFLLMIAGLLVVPIRGLLLERAYAERMRATKASYVETLDRAAQKQVEFGRQMRLDAVAPFMRLVETQINSVDSLKTELETHQQQLTLLEKELSGLR
jgi:hypothetical protein